MSGTRGIGDTYTGLHLEEGLSARDIAKLSGNKYASVISLLHHRGILRPAKGRAVEEQVAVWLETKGFSITRKPGNHPYDLLVGLTRVDVKSSRLINNGRGHYIYSFDLQHAQSATKDLRVACDTLLLVLLDKPGTPMYLLYTAHLPIIQTLRFRDHMKTKYPLQMIGYLDENL